MKPQAVMSTLWAIAKLAEKGVEVDAAATVRAVSDQAPRVPGKMVEVSNTLWGVAKLAEKGVEVDAAAVRAVKEQAEPSRAVVEAQAWRRADMSAAVSEAIAEAKRKRQLRAKWKRVHPKKGPAGGPTWRYVYNHHS
jgi:hypothetical protein